MRTRKEITDDYQELIEEGDNFTVHEGMLLLEVLLDIRSQLEENKKAKP
jgi:hypothetical protein